jgi:hypothetical protein
LTTSIPASIPASKSVSIPTTTVIVTDEGNSSDQQEEQPKSRQQALYKQNDDKDEDDEDNNRNTNMDMDINTNNDEIHISSFNKGEKGEKGEKGDHPTISSVITIYLFHHKVPISSYTSNMAKLKDELKSLNSWRSTATRDINKALNK